MKQSKYNKGVKYGGYMNELLNACQEEVFRNKKLLCNTCINNSDAYISSMCLFCFKGDNFDAIQVIEKPVETLPEKGCYNCEWNVDGECEHGRGCEDESYKEWALSFMEDMEVEI